MKWIPSRSPPVNLASLRHLLLVLLPGKGTINVVDKESSSASHMLPLGDVVKLIPVHVQDLFTRPTVNLNEEQSIKLALFLTQFADIFAKDDTNLGCFSQQISKYLGKVNMSREDTKKHN